MVFSFSKRNYSTRQGLLEPQMSKPSYSFTTSLRSKYCVIITVRQYMSSFPSVMSLTNLFVFFFLRRNNRQQFQFDTKLAEFEKGFTLKTGQMFSVHTTLEKAFKKRNFKRSYFRLVSVWRKLIGFESSVFRLFSVHTKTQSGVSNSSGLRSVFSKLRLRHGFRVRHENAVDLTVEIKLRFQGLILSTAITHATIIFLARFRSIQNHSQRE